MRFTFPKNEKLKSQKLISLLFSEGKSISKFPFKLVYIPIESDQGHIVKAAFSVPKRNFKKAVDRNRVKRLMRESYRLNKAYFFNNLPTSFAFMFLYLGKDMSDFKTSNKKISQILEQFTKKNLYEEKDN